MLVRSGEPRVLGANGAFEWDLSSGSRANGIFEYRFRVYYLKDDKEKEKFLVLATLNFEISYTLSDGSKGQDNF